MSIADRYAGLIIDLDGVVVHGDEAIRPAVQFIRRAVRQGHELLLVTNDATQTAEEWIATLQGHRLNLEPDQVLTSAEAAARLLQSEPPARCYVIGEYGLTATLRAAGAVVVEDQSEADTVVVGADKQLTYAKLKNASLAIFRGARFVGTNADALYPATDGAWPGTGATLAYLRTATGVAPEIVGKPQTPMLELAAERIDRDGPLLLVGDQIETDIVAAQRMGWDSALVLSGRASWSSLIGAPAPPTWVVPDLGDLDGPEPPVVRHAREADLSAIRSLLEAADFDVEGAARRLDTTLVAEAPDGEVVGTASWEMVGTAAHLRGITVDVRERGHGTGSHLVARALDELLSADVEWVYLLTPGADEMFEKLGFWRVHRDRVPTEILETAQFGAAATGSRALVRRLRGAGEIR